MGDTAFRKRNVLVLVFEIILIVIAVGGLTLATTTLMNGSRTIIQFGRYNVDYKGEIEIVATELEPISDSLINYDTSEGVIRLEFSLRGVDTNENPDNLIYDVMINEMNIDCSLLNEYTKWNLYKEGELLSSGNFSPTFDGNVLTDNFRLTEIQQKLPLDTDDYDNYVLIIWISEACDDLSSCDLVNQIEVVNSEISMNVFIAIHSGEPVQYERVPNLDATCVNKPELYDGMIPVYYNNGEWKIADKTNATNSQLWYDYGDSRWANAVFVNSLDYKDSNSGTVVKQEDILGYYVWIPRFKYKLWNSGEDIVDTYDAYNKGIDIVFESGTHNSGTIKCLDGKCNARNNEYLTHPAFGDDLKGFWISKYEISNDNKFIPNTESIKNDTIENYKNYISSLSNKYELEETVNSHIITNLEWGATLYLSHSKYGVCLENSCKEIATNNTSLSEGDKGDTTTRDVYGVYDMSGALAEYVLGDMGIGSATSEVRLSENSTWYNGSYIISDTDYIIRGGKDRGLFSTSGIGMFDVTTRSVLVSK